VNNLSAAHPKVASVGASRFFPLVDNLVASSNVRFWGQSGHGLCGISLSRSLLAIKRTCLFALHMSAFDPKRTCCTGIGHFGLKTRDVARPIAKAPMTNQQEADA
jgi:hypothetical protein